MKLTEKHKLKLRKMVNELGAQPTAIKMIDHYLKKYSGTIFTSADLPDTATFGSGLDEVEEFLNDGEYETAYDIAKDTAADMLEDEGFTVYRE